MTIQEAQEEVSRHIAAQLSLAPRAPYKIALTFEFNGGSGGVLNSVRWKNFAEGEFRTCQLQQSS
jgi:hypothetical protein